MVHGMGTAAQWPGHCGAARDKEMSEQPGISTWIPSWAVMWMSTPVFWRPASSALNKGAMQKQSEEQGNVWWHGAAQSR